MESKHLTHAIRTAAFNTVTALARDLRVNTGYAHAADEAHTLIRQALTPSSDIHATGEGQMTIHLDPMPTPRATKAIADVCEHLTATRTHYPGTGSPFATRSRTIPDLTQTIRQCQESWCQGSKGRKITV
ncbi:putative transposase [Pseudarthrobacter sp. Y6]|uniref:putative transposase n=1 Tax=Pseudarthrobacter sp. Y6 TaxID=3418422 RepID=UPI003CFB407A